MASERVPDPLARFLRDDVASVRDVETLLRLRETRARAWTPEALSAELRSSPGWAAQQLEALRARGLVEPAVDTSGAPAYRYAPATPELTAMVDALADLFVRRKNTVIALIFGDSPDPVQSLSEAFRIRRKP